MEMRFILIVLIFLSITANSCKSDDDDVQFEATGQIVGLDMRQCPCCGNWLITIDGVPETRQFEVLPDGSGIDLDTANFPISVKFNWEESGVDCEWIIITEIAIQ